MNHEQELVDLVDLGGEEITSSSFTKKDLAALCDLVKASLRGRDFVAQITVCATKDDSKVTNASVFITSDDIERLSIKDVTCLMKGAMLAQSKTADIVMQSIKSLEDIG